MARAIWKGNISFGLVNIPVGLFSAASPDELTWVLTNNVGYESDGPKRAVIACSTPGAHQRIPA